MGAWTFVEPNLEWVLEQIERAAERARYVGRPASASTAAGLMSQAPERTEGLPRRGAYRL